MYIYFQLIDFMISCLLMLCFVLVKLIIESCLHVSSEGSHGETCGWTLQKFGATRHRLCQWRINGSRCEHLRAKGANSRTHGDILQYITYSSWHWLTILDHHWPILTYILYVYLVKAIQLLWFPRLPRGFPILRASYQPHAAGVSLRLQGGRTVRYLSLDAFSLCAAGSCWSDLSSPCFCGSSLCPKCAAVSSREIRKWKT